MHFMDDPSERLRKARRMAGYKTMRQAAEAHGLDYPTYAGHENGHRGFSHVAPRYAQLFKVNLIWLMTGRGNPKTKPGHDPVVEMFQALPPDKQAQIIDFMTYLSARKE
jgi:hypothetical protein